jgi:RNA polymerase sigma factor (sigma-70 family)
MAFQLSRMSLKRMAPMNLYAARFVGNVSEDIVQEAFVKMIEYPHLEINEAERLLTTIVKNKCIDHLRYIKRQKKWMNCQPTQNFNTEMKLPFDEADLRRQLEIVSPQSRKCIELRYFGQYRVNEIADMLNIDHSSVSTAIKRGLIKLRSFR